MAGETKPSVHESNEGSVTSLGLSSPSFFLPFLSDADFPTYVQLFEKSTWFGVEQMNKLSCPSFQRCPWCMMNYNKIFWQYWVLIWKSPFKLLPLTGEDLLDVNNSCMWIVIGVWSGKSCTYCRQGAHLIVSEVPSAHLWGESPPAGPPPPKWAGDAGPKKASLQLYNTYKVAQHE